MFGESCDASAPGGSIDGGVEPECEEDARIDGVASDFPLDRLDGLVEECEVEGFGELPDDPNAVLGGKPLIEAEAFGFVVVVA